MHGVLLSSLPVGAGPSTPAEMIDLLPVRLREWVPLSWGELPSAMGDLVVLTDNGELTEEALEAGMNYLEALYGDDGYFDLGGTWLPAWVRQTAEQTERAAFRHIRSGGQAGYVAARTMLTEVPYGTDGRVWACSLGPGVGGGVVVVVAVSAVPVSDGAAGWAVAV